MIGGAEEVVLFSGVCKVNAAIAHVCYANKVPFIAVRSISDNEENSGEDNLL
jgi:nucleoside phosphorylase